MTLHQKVIRKKNTSKFPTSTSGIFKEGLPLYIFQKRDHHPYQCGPFAIYNLLIKHQKYCGLSRLIRLCKATALNGTLCKNMDAALIKINKICDVNIQSIAPTFDTICDTIKQNGSVIVLFHWQDANASTDKDANASTDKDTNASTDKDANASSSGEHYALIESLSNYKFKVINYSFVDEIKYITRRELKTILISHKNVEFNEVYPKAWCCIMKTL